MMSAIVQTFKCHCVEHSYTPIGTIATSNFVQTIEADDEHAAFTEAMQRLRGRQKSSQTIVSSNVYHVEQS